MRALARSLTRRDGTAPRHLQTHISHVLLHGGFAYKIKKALATPFLDQSTLARRLHACEEELRLNRRLAPDLYLDVVRITGSLAQPVIDARQRAKQASGPVPRGRGRALEVAVKMRAFDEAGLWDRLAARGELGAADVDELARVLARFHAQAARLDDARVVGPKARPSRHQRELGTPATQHALLTATLDELRASTNAAAWPDAAARATLAQLAAWDDAAYARLEPVIARRRAAGRVRECHGDLHLGNIARERGHCLVFDGIEFSDRLRWIDTASDLAFATMDLEAHALPALAHRLVNAYVEAGGDDDGVRVLDYHAVYRALVRAKVARMRAGQTDGEARLDAVATARRYLALTARTALEPRPRALFITHGLSGSGKTTSSIGLVEAAGAVRMRADVERKRLAGLEPWQSSRSAPGGGLYTSDLDAATYARLFDAAAAVLDGGRPAVLDATFLRHADRAAARSVAAAHGVPFVILHFDAPPDVLRQRLRQRAALGRDASEADERVLELQLARQEPLRADEAAFVHAIDTARGTDGDSAPGIDWMALLARAGRGDVTPP